MNLYVNNVEKADLAHGFLLRCAKKAKRKSVADDIVRYAAVIPDLTTEIRKLRLMLKSLWLYHTTLYEEAGKRITHQAGDELKDTMLDLVKDHLYECGIIDENGLTEEDQAYLALHRR